MRFFRCNQTGHVGRAECCREVSGFSTVLGPLIAISQRQAAPSRYQHIISGLVQPLNHTRHRNPLVSVTFSPTQEARSQSSIWMLWSLSFHPYLPQIFFFIRHHKTFPNTALQLPFLHLLHTVYFHLCRGSNLPVYHRTTLSTSSLQKRIFPSRTRQDDVQHTRQSCSWRSVMRVKLWCHNQIAYIFLEIDITW